MVIAQFGGKGTDQGKEISCVGGAYRTADGEILSFARILELDRGGGMVWVDARMRAWVLALPEDAPGSVPPDMAWDQTSRTAPTRRTSLTGEQLRIIAYILIGMAAVALLVVFGRDAAETTSGPTTAGAGSLVQVVSLDGTGEMTSSAVSLTGSLQHLDWNVTGGETVRVRFCLVPIGAIQPATAFVVIDTTASGQGVATTHVPSGSYTMVVLTSDDAWSFTLSDDRRESAAAPTSP